MRFVWLLVVAVALPGFALAEGLFDGQVFEGTIGPADNPDLEDRLHFDDGYFWSGICTACGFMPGPYKAEKTDAGIVFEGVLESESRGQFQYDGLVGNDGLIQVSIAWERKRWYWTNRRALVFRGASVVDTKSASLADTLNEIAGLNIDGNPLCARF